MSLKLLNGTIDLFKVGGKETLIIRGIIDPRDGLDKIKVAPYQREILPGSKAKSLAAAFRTSTVPDIELGMRGDKYRVHQDENTAGETFFLQNDVYVIDGLQRITAARLVRESDPEEMPRVGALIHINTTEEWETARFRILNQERSKLSANVLLRNLRKKSDSIEMLHKLSTGDETFVLHERVQWRQRMLRHDLISAMVMTQTVGFLHSRFGPGRGVSPDDLASTLDKTMGIVGRTTMRDNVKTFFDLLDECFGLRRVVYTHGAVVVRRSFMLVLAEIFTRHSNFWRGHRLFVEKELKHKIAKFPINDPEVIRLASSGGTARELLYQLMIKHINSGKRTKRLELVDGLKPHKQVPAEVSAEVSAAEA